MVLVHDAHNETCESGIYSMCLCTADNHDVILKLTTIYNGNVLCGLTVNMCDMVMIFFNNGYTELSLFIDSTGQIQEKGSKLHGDARTARS